MIKPHKVDEKYSVIGLMSGTSLDGLDIVFCRISVENNKWNYIIENAETIAYSKEWKSRLLGLEKADALTFQQAHMDYGIYLGEMVNSFMKKYAVQADFVSSHGHTIFHQPQHQLTVQLGNGAAIAATCKLPVVCDFRTLDVALGGQGAPLVPVGDELLFQNFDYCLNLGGFANISFKQNEKIIAFDICPVNIVMNVYAEKLGTSYDSGGSFAKGGVVNPQLLNKLNQLSFYHLPLNKPKSLGKEWVLENILPLLENAADTPSTILRTFCEHIAIQISNVVQGNSPMVLTTGGGAYNTFLIERIQALSVGQIILPDKQTIEFKEALIFALLGVLRVRNEVNCLKSVTGAEKDSSGGVIYIV